jgi:hypothetical protein
MEEGDKLGGEEWAAATKTTGLARVSSTSIGCPAGNRARVARNDAFAKN